MRSAGALTIHRVYEPDAARCTKALTLLLTSHAAQKETAAEAQLSTAVAKEARRGGDDASNR